MLTANEIRKGFIDFFAEKQHAFVPSSAVVPADDPTLLFINAGMNQFKDIFLGSRKPDCSRVANSQKCIRAGGKHNDLEEVGKDTYHHTFFEMLGNWSFGDYFKAEAIEWAWELLTKVWHLEPERLYATYFQGNDALGLEVDAEARDLWLKILPANHVIPGNVKDNFWEMADTGPCGPCSELHYDGRSIEQRLALPGEKLVNKDDPDVIEIWNLVFIQFNRDAKGLTPLPAKHVDTGMGFERIVRFMQSKNSNYDTDVFAPIFQQIQKITNSPDYAGSMDNPHDIAYRVLADHIRTLTFAIADGATPSNDGRGYVLRRILRRATRFALSLDMHEPFLYKIVPTIAKHMGETFPELKLREQHVANVIKAEEQSFSRTLDRGIAIFEADIAELQEQKQSTLSGQKAFRLYDTFGFPLDLTQLIADERGLKVDVDQFETLMTQQRDLARASQKSVEYQADELADKLPQTGDSQKYDATTLTTTILGYVIDNQFVTEGGIPAKTTVGIVTQDTCAYAEAGGQVGDAGTITSQNTDKNASFNFQTTKRIGNAVVHFGQSDDADHLNVAEKCTITIDITRNDTQRNHTATHLLQWALQEVLGKHAHQEGSFVCPEYLRFDFTHPKALTDDEIRQVEQLVREKIDQAYAVTSKTMPIEKAKQLGAMALFSEKYGDSVRVLAIGTDDANNLEGAFSREFCGGTHVANTIDIASFKITRQESISTGVRRITALTGRSFNSVAYQRCLQIDQLTTLLKATPEDIYQRVEALIDDSKKLKKQLKAGSANDLKATAGQLLDNAQKIGDASIIVGQVPTASVEAIRSQIDWLRKKTPSCAIVLGSKTDDNKVLLFAAVSDDLIEKGLKAGDIVKQIAPIVGGGGGGRPQLAQAGGKNPKKLTDAINTAKQIIDKALV